MPVHKGKDFYQWGKHGKKYHYILNNKKSRESAKAKAAKQGRAIKASQSKRFI
jgi:hypothetical protein